MTEQPFDPAQVDDISLAPEQVVVSGTVLSLVMLALPLAVYAVFYGVGSLFRYEGSDLLVMLVLFIALIFAHEGFHALGWMLFGGIKPSQISFGFLWKTLSPYAHAKAPMTAQAYRIGVILPLIFTGLLPFVVALALGSTPLAVVSALMISAAIGDVLVLWVIREVGAERLVLDHPSRIGCVVLKA